jgi:hypothetical protein
MFVLVFVTLLTATNTKFYEFSYHEVYNIRIRVTKTNFMHYLSSVHFVNLYMIRTYL